MSGREAVDLVFQGNDLVEKYGRAIDSDFLDRVNTLRTYLDKLESIILGESPVTLIDTGSPERYEYMKTIDSVADMRFLVETSSRFRVREIHTIRIGWGKYSEEFGMGYYDLLDAAGSTPRVFEKYSRLITRADANPQLAKSS